MEQVPQIVLEYDPQFAEKAARLQEALRIAEGEGQEGEELEQTLQHWATLLDMRVRVVVEGHNVTLEYEAIRMSPLRLADLPSLN